MDIVIRDTKSGADRPLVPGPGGTVGIYACGPTVYGPIHIGNARPFVVFSLYKRFLRSQGLDVTLVINVTDVNDKIYNAARGQHIASAQLATDMTARYLADTDALGLGRPDVEPLATETIAEIIELIERWWPAATPTSPAATCTSTCAATRPTARCRIARSMRWTRARATTGRT